MDLRNRGSGGYRSRRGLSSSLSGCACFCLLEGRRGRHSGGVRAEPDLDVVLTSAHFRLS